MGECTRTAPTVDAGKDQKFEIMKAMLCQNAHSVGFGQRPVLANPGNQQAQKH